MKKIRRLIITSVVLFVSGYCLLFFSPKPRLLADYSFSSVVVDAQDQLIRITLSQDEKYRVYTPLKKMPKQLINTTLLQEDRYFRWHSGVNPFALFRAVWSTYVIQSRKIGASTITMQLARIRFGIHSKKPLGKIEQMIRAIQLEMHYSKDELLDAYLNLAPYGGNIEGAGAASLVYFHQHLEKITLLHALSLSIIPQNPNKRASNNKELKRIRDHLFNRWLAIHPEDNNKSSLLSLPLAMYTVKQLPFTAPHFVNSALKIDKLSPYLVTTLNSHAQRIIEQSTQRYLARKNLLGVYNAAVVLLDTQDMSIKSLLGSSDFFNKPISGQINGTEIKRSPGSTLKPFIYGLALDQGLIHPNTVLKDVPYHLNGYNPENFDYEFIGPVKAKDALTLSRNIPAITLSSQLTKPSLYELLQQAGVTHLKPESYYGLSLGLGGSELTMKELVGLYAMLANEGVWYPLRSLKSEPHAPGQRLFSREASFLVLDMLHQNPRSGLVAEGRTSIPVSWKTGTSSRYRDAWTVGVFGPYVLGVWLGNFDNTANPAFIGKELAAPLFFELVDALQHEFGPISSPDKHIETMNLRKVAVCKNSGLLPTRYCPSIEWTWFIPGKSPIKKDTIYREVAINRKTGLRTCHIDKDTRFEIFEFWPSDLLSVFKKAGIQRHTPPFFEADCPLSNNQSVGPKISSPQLGVDYIIPANSRQNSTIPLSAVTDGGVSHLFWFLGETFLAKTAADESYLWQAKPGTFTIRVVDDRGLSDSQEIVLHLEI